MYCLFSGIFFVIAAENKPENRKKHPKGNSYDNIRDKGVIPGMFFPETAPHAFTHGYYTVHNRSPRDLLSELYHKYRIINRGSAIYKKKYTVLTRTGRKFMLNHRSGWPGCGVFPRGLPQNLSGKS
jgi:hypothetical protein